MVLDRTKMLESNDDLQNQHIDNSEDVKTDQTEDHSNEDSQKDRQKRSNEIVDQTEVTISDPKLFSILYLSRGLSSWGDRLWAFGIGIFMNLMGPKNLRLVRTYPFNFSLLMKDFLNFRAFLTFVSVKEGMLTNKYSTFIR